MKRKILISSCDAYDRRAFSGACDVFDESEIHTIDQFVNHRLYEEVDILITDMKSIGPILGALDNYKAINEFIARNPKNSTIILASAVSKMTLLDIRQSILETYPSQDVRVIDWSDQNPYDSLRDVLYGLIPPCDQRREV